MKSTSCKLVNKLKLIKSTLTLSIYDNSENRRGADAIRVTHAEVTSPTTADLNDLYI